MRKKAPTKSVKQNSASDFTMLRNFRRYRQKMRERRYRAEVL